MKRFHPIYIALVIVCFALLSCNRGNGNIYDNFKKVKDSGDLCSVTVSLDTVGLEAINSSGVSFSGICSDGSIYYYDSYFAWVYKFDTEGNLLGRYLGYGRGPKESTVKHGKCFVESNDSKWAIFGPSMDYELFDKDFNAINRFRISFKGRSADPEDFTTYSIYPNTVCRMVDGLLYSSTVSENPSFNYIDTYSEYVKNARHISVVDMQTGDPLKMVLKGLPPVYEERKYECSLMDNVFFDIDADKQFYLNFQADSLIYVFNGNFKPLYAFGCAGKDIDLAYQPVRSWKEDRVAIMCNMREKGYYSNIEYIDETGLCFRSYVKGKHSECDGLQIYRGGVLIGDCEVPKGFRVTGYVAPYYYSQVYDENDGDKLYVYRFTL